MADYGTRKGSFESGSAQENGKPTGSGKPSTGFDNSSKGTLAEAGPGPGVGPNSRRIS